MAEIDDVYPVSSPEKGAEPIKEDVKIPADPTPDPKSEEKPIPRERLNEEIKKRQALEVELEALKKQPAPKPVNKSLDVEDYIDISASLDGLDQREKEYLAQQSKLSGKPLKEIRSSEDYVLWQSAYKTKVEKERLTLKPSSTQPESERVQSFEDKLASATSIEEKEKLLSEAGLIKKVRPRVDRSSIGTQR